MEWFSRDHDLKRRTRTFAVRIVLFVANLPKTTPCGIIGKQLLRCGTSVGANYRAACRAKSQRDFIAKMGIVEEEADETVYWLEILVETQLATMEVVRPLLQEANELVAITVSSIKTARFSARSAAAKGDHR